MSKVIDSLEKVLLPFAVKIGKQPHINAIKNGFIKLMPLTLAGAMFVLINNVFPSFGEGSFFYSMGIRLDASTIETLNGFKTIGGNVYNGTLGICLLYTSLSISAIRGRGGTLSGINPGGAIAPSLSRREDVYKRQPPKRWAAASPSARCWPQRPAPA